MSKVLVVDDEADLRLLVRLALEREGHEVHEAGDGREALEALGAPDDPLPELVLLDLTMPDVDGWGVLAGLSPAAREHTKVVVLSAHASPSTVARAKAAGCVGYVSKPFAVRELLSVVREVLAA